MKLVKAQTQSDYFACMLIRSIVFMHEQKVNPLVEIDKEDLHCDHFLLKYNDKDVACARVIKQDDIWHIGRVAVLKEYRNHHFGSFILEELAKKAKEAQIHTLKLGAQVQALPFYEKNGYHICSDVYMDADIEHKWMERNI